MKQPVNQLSPPPPQQWPEPDPAPAPPRRYATPGLPEFYPLTIGRTVSLAVNMFRFGWRTFVPISVLASIPLVIVNALVTTSTFQVMADWQRSLVNDVFATSPDASAATDLIANFPWQALTFTFAIALLIGPLVFICNGALINATGTALAGGRLSTAGSYRVALRRVLGLLGLYLVITALGLGLSLLLSFGPVLLVVAPGALGGGGPAAFAALVIGVLVVFLSAFVLIRLFFAVQALIIEDAPVGTALRRSYALVSGAMWRVIGYTIVFGLVLGLIGIGIGIVALFAGALVAPQSAVSATAPLDLRSVIVQDVISGLLAAVFAPISTIGLVLLYFDLRWRHGESVPVPGGGESAGRPVALVTEKDQ